MCAATRKKEVFGCGPPPAACDICARPIDNAYVDPTASTYETFLPFELAEARAGWTQIEYRHGDVWETL